MTDAHTTADLEELQACVAELLDRDLLLARVHLLLPDLDAGGWSDGKQKLKKQPVAPTPWNDAAAGFVTDVHAGAREHESALTLLLFRSARFRGGADEATAGALRALPDLILAAADRHGRQHHIPSEAARALRSWPRQARRLLDEARYGEEPWTRAPGGLRCPYCNRRLELRPGWDREPSPAIWCRRCPASEDHESRSWPADAWLAVLQHQDSDTAASRGA